MNKNIIELAKKDSQINTSGIFRNFTDFQNIMISDLTLVEILYEGEEEKLKNKTIFDLYTENNFNANIEYDKLIFTAKEMFEMTKDRTKYRDLVLGKLVRYGFYNIKIKEKISGEDGFDAFILEDKNKNIMLYFTCTNIIEEEDFLYDAYPLIENISKKTNKFSNIIGSKKIYTSQNKQAIRLIKKCLNELKNTSKIIVAGFSLGGSLAEKAYLNVCDKYNDKIDRLILFNPYHNKLNDNDILILKSNKKVKIYATEGDIVSTVFNYSELEKITKTVYIDYNTCIDKAINEINNNKNVLNILFEYFKNKYCDYLICTCIEVKRKHKLNLIIKVALNISISKLKKLKLKNIDAIVLIEKLNKIINKISPILKKFKYDIQSKYNLIFLKNLKYIEIIFTSLHLPYIIDINKDISFDKNGKIQNKIEVDNTFYSLSYPSFEETSKQLFGCNAYDELSKIIKDLLK